MTFPPKVLGQVTSCKECPNYVYYSGGDHHCRLVAETVLEESIVAPFCPLPDYPSRTIAEMQTTILGLRKSSRNNFEMDLLTHIASRLKLNLHPSGTGMMISFNDHGRARDIYFGIEYIRGMVFRPLIIIFVYGDKTYKIAPDADPIILYEAVNEEGTRWLHHDLTN